MNENYLANYKEYDNKVQKILSKAKQENDAKNIENFLKNKPKEELKVVLPPPPIYRLFIRI